MNPSLILVALLLFAGCVQPAETSAPTADAALGAEGEPAAPNVTAPNVVGALLGNSTTRDAAVDYTVETDGPVTVTLRLNGTVFLEETIEAARTWTIPLAYGRTPFEAHFLAPGLDHAQALTLTRLGATRITIDFGVFHPNSQGQPSSIVHDLWIDVSDRPSAPMYAKQSTKNLDAFTAHDQLMVFEETTGKKVEYGWNANFKQFGVDKIDGAGNSVSASAPPWWCYSVNGKSADGISIQRIVPGDAVVWRLGTCS